MSFDSYKHNETDINNTKSPIKEEKITEKENLFINLINSPKSPRSEIITKIMAIRQKFANGYYILSVISRQNSR
jgi:hypothetical protein